MTSQFSSLTERERSSRSPARETAQHETPSQHPLLGLQAKLGNAQVARMLQRSGVEEEEPLQGKHDPDIARSGVEEEEELQAKHDPEIARSGVEEEEELQAKHDPDIARAAEEEELQAKHDPAPKVGLEGGPVGQAIEERISAQRGNGSGLDDGTRNAMEGAFGTSFADVRVHRDTESDALNRSITAKAFTTGSDIFLRRDQDPGDQSLMAHELTHVVQQRSMGGSGGGMEVGAAGSQHEQEADSVAHEVVSRMREER